MRRERMTRGIRHKEPVNGVNKRERENKYHNIPEDIDGIHFTSKKEARRYVFLKDLMVKGRVTKIECQPKYLLQPGFRKCYNCHVLFDMDDKRVKKGKCPDCGEPLTTFLAINYIADFRVTYFDGHEEIEDVKGKIQTESFKNKRKIFERQYPHLRLIIMENW